ncbi:MAG: hypothetical protein H0X34_16355 [Chthoniobacterales bacterium]|nr:hypothetical protein [Chthoniobacterales bacterium]
MKFPTGDSSRIKEEFNEAEVEGAPQSGIHGHDLTLGTGSYDGIFGGQTSLRYKNFFLDQEAQFTLRGTGSISITSPMTFRGTAGRATTSSGTQTQLWACTR